MCRSSSARLWLSTSRILRIDPNLGDRGIIGLLNFAFLGCLLNFFTPLTPGIHITILAVGVVLAGINVRQLKNSKIIWAAAVLILVYVLSRPQFHFTYDSGLYHLQTLKWIREEPIVPGLANLHSRLAVNSAIFLIAAVVDQDGIGWVSNCLVVLFVLISLFIRLRNVIAGHRSGVEFWILFFSFIVFMADSHILPSWYGVTNGDLFIAALIIYWTCIAVGLPESSHLPTEVAVVVLSAVLAVIVKASAAPLLLPALAIVWIHRQRIPVPTLRRAAAFVGLTIGVWMLRGVVLSGCAVYPANATCITSLPWAESGQRVGGMSRAIRSWARHPGEADFAKVLRDQTWLPGWLLTARDDLLLRLLIIFAPLGLISALLRRRFRGQPASGLLLVAAGLAACLLFWFLTAPDTRFGEGFILAASLMGGALTFAACFDQPRFSAYAPALLAAAMVVFLQGVRFRVPIDYLGWPLPEVPAHEYKDAHGNRIFVVQGNDQNQCWNHPLPCSPYFDYQALEKIRWPRTLPAPPPGWKPEEPSPFIWKDVEGNR